MSIASPHRPAPTGAPQSSPVRLAIGLKSTAQSLALVGLAGGAFEAAGIELTIARMETAGPAGIAGLIAGEWDIAEFGVVPVVQWALDGNDPLILLAAEPRPALYIVGGRGIDTSGQLKGGQIGVLTETGQTGYVAGEMLRRWGLCDQVSLLSLHRYPVIYDELLKGNIAAGVLPADYRFAAAERGALPVLAELGDEFEFQGPVVVTTRQFARRRPDIVSRIVEGYARALHVFKNRPETTLAVLRSHLDFADDAAIARIYRFYAGRFSTVPRPSVAGIESVIASFRATRPAAFNLKPEDIYEPRFLDQLERDGLFERLHPSASS